MLYRILVATPTLGFGELIRQSLEDAGTFSVVITSGCETAVQLAEKEAYALAILDSDLDECLLTELAEKLRAATERQGEALRLLIVPPGENETAEYEALQVDGYISKPFYLPDLLEKVSRILGVEQPVTADPLEAEAPAPRAGDWPEKWAGQKPGAHEPAPADRSGSRLVPGPGPGPAGARGRFFRQHGLRRFCAALRPGMGQRGPDTGRDQPGAGYIAGTAVVNRQRHRPSPVCAPGGLRRRLHVVRH